jgi:hypothetical protein
MVDRVTLDDFPVGTRVRFRLRGVTLVIGTVVDHRSRPPRAVVRYAVPGRGYDAHAWVTPALLELA